MHATGPLVHISTSSPLTKFDLHKSLNYLIHDGRDLLMGNHHLAVDNFNNQMQDSE
jgi:hypothetical protein